MIWRGPMVMSAITRCCGMSRGEPLIFWWLICPRYGDAQLTLAQNAAVEGAISFHPQDLS